MRHVLVTGGAGYIGTHTVVALVSAGARVTVVDSLVNAHDAALDRARALVDHPERIAFVRVSRRGGRLRRAASGPARSLRATASGARRVFLLRIDFSHAQADLRDKAAVSALFSRAAAEGPFHAVIHFAALKAVGESVAQPLAYYENNIAVGSPRSCFDASAPAGRRRRPTPARLPLPCVRCPPFLLRAGDPEPARMYARARRARARVFVVGDGVRRRRDAGGRL